MSNFIVCLDAVLPVFLIMMIGFACKHMGIIKEENVKTMNGLMFRIFIPFMVFFNIYNSTLSSISSPGIIIYAIVTVIAEYFLSLLILNIFKIERSNKSALIQGLYRSNFIVFGIPIASSLVADKDLGIVAILTGIIIPMFNVFAVISIETFDGKKVDIKSVVLNILKNPLIIGCLSGLVFMLSGIKLPQVVEKTISQVASVASPMMLFLVGAFFRFKGLSRFKKELAISTIGKLIVFPVIFLTLGIVLGFRGMELAALLGIIGSGVAISTFTMTQAGNGNGELAGYIVVLSNFLCSFTLFAWAYVLKSLGYL